MARRSAVAFLVAVFAVWTLGNGPASAITVYDCVAKGTTYERVDMTGIEECPDPKRDYEEEVLLEAQLLQTDSKTPVTAYRLV